MSATITTDIFCDVCANWEHGVTSFSEDVRAARLAVSNLGWVTDRVGLPSRIIDICPDCSSQDETSSS